MSKKPRRYEGSPRDVREDARGAQRMGVSLKNYETTPQDKREDRAGQRRMMSSRPNKKGR